MTIDFTGEELEIIKNSLKETKRAYESLSAGSPDSYYTSAEFKKSQIAGVEAVEAKIRQTKKAKP